MTAPPGNAPLSILMLPGMLETTEGKITPIIQFSVRIAQTDLIEKNQDFAISFLVVQIKAPPLFKGSRFSIIIAAVVHCKFSMRLLCSTSTD